MGITLLPSLKVEGEVFSIMALAERRQVEKIVNNDEEKILEFTPEQMEILWIEYEEKFIYHEISNQEFEDLVNTYRKEHFVNRRDAINTILKNNLEY